MKSKIGLVLGITVSLILIGVSSTFSQEQALEEPEKQATLQAEPELLWLWGEVVSVDTQKNEILIKTPDYETDQEKEIAISADEHTAYENAASLSEIKPSNTLTIDYTVSLDGKNIAKNISVEKPEIEPIPLPESILETTPETAPEAYPEEAPLEIPPEG